MSAGGVDLADKISVRSGLRHVKRFRGTGVRHAVFQKNLRFVDMPQGDVGERGCCQRIPIKWDMFRVTAVEHENSGASRGRQGNIVGFRLGDFGRVVAKAVDLRVQLLEIDGREVLVHQKCDVRRPGEAQEGGTLPNPVMVPGDDDNAGSRNRGEQVVDLFQIPR